MSDISEIVGLIPTEITQLEDEIVMKFSNGSVGKFYHDRECSECVMIDDVSGDWSDLIGNPLLVAEERESDVPPREKKTYEYWECSNTWTFYTFRGIGGSVDVRWHGSSNGHYSESVSFYLFAPST